LREALEELSSAHAEVLRLIMEEGLTPAEIAERLGLAAGTVKTRISNGMRALRVALAEPGSTRSEEGLPT
jgi:RNA polymerase sigma-70 factor, ECF subfamily